MQEWNAGFDNTKPFPWLPGHIDTMTEPVLSLVQKNGFGLGVYSSATTKYRGGDFKFHMHRDSLWDSPAGFAREFFRQCTGIQISFYGILQGSLAQRALAALRMGPQAILHLLQ